MRSCFIALACFGLLFTSTIHSQSGIEPQAGARLLACRQAMGSAPPGYSIQGTGSIQDSAVSDQTPTTLNFRTTGSLFAIWRETTNGKTIIRQWAGKRSRVLGADGKAQRMGISDSVYRVPELVPSYACHLDGPVPSSEVKFLGVEDRGGQNVDHLRIRMNDGRLPSISEKIRRDIQSFDLYLATDSHQVVSITRYLASPQALENRQLMEFRFSDYERVGGVLIPHSVIRILGGQPYDAITITSVGVGAPLAAGDFQ